MRTALLVFSLLFFYANALKSCEGATAPVENLALTLCTEFAAQTCCASDTTIKAQFDVFTASASTQCKNLMKKVYCASCDPDYSHLFLKHHTMVIPARTKPVICEDFARRIYTACYAQITASNDTFNLGFGDGLTEQEFVDENSLPGAIICVGGDEEGRVLPTATVAASALTFTGAVDVRIHNGEFFVVQRNGLILRFTTGAATTFLDLSSKVSSGGHGGLLGLEFHPDYDSNSYFYVFYTQVGTADIVVARYTESGVDTINTESIIFTVDPPGAINVGGWLAFGLDGDLYVSIGDGTNPTASASSASFLGKILVIDGGNLVTPTIYASGLRNPFRCSIDSVDGELWCGDPGDTLYEEVDIIRQGANYGWNTYEAFSCHTPPCNTSGLTFPLLYYTRNMQYVSGRSIIGGRIYRGSEYPYLQNSYVFSDYVESRLMRTSRDGSVVELLISGTDVSQITAYAEDPSTKELYFLSSSSLKKLDFEAIDFADLYISSWSVSGRVIPFDVDIQVDVTVINNGPASADNVVYEFAVPELLAFTDSTFTCEGSSVLDGEDLIYLSGSICQKSFGTLPATETLTIPLSFIQPDVSLPCDTPEVTSYARVSSSVADPSISNNNHIIAMDVDLPVYLVVELRLAEPLVTVNDETVFMIDVTNKGLYEASGFTINVTFPSGAITVTDPLWSCSSSWCIRTFTDTLEINEKFTTSLKTTVFSYGTFSVTAFSLTCPAETVTLPFRTDCRPDICPYYYNPLASCPTNWNNARQNLCTLISGSYEKRAFIRATAISKLKAGAGLPGQFINGLCCDCACSCQKLDSSVIPSV